ncbi:head-tail connector protein [Paenibacillus silvisoli]|uniref:head-tail connector protein n=1 Tax=Paenibacillus silvisoli TaxID=3110539 RepID=UPI0028058040|nr:head-tail connector protein [Paenibacillus silvisoli]
MSSNQLAQVKEYLRVDFTEDDGLIDGFILAAKGYLANAGVPEPLEAGDQYNLILMMLVALFYEKRDSTDLKIPAIIHSFITQLSIKAGAG